MAKLAKNIEHNNRMSNYMEELAVDVLDDLLVSEYKGESFSPNAIQDIKALALNRLWPMYTTSDTGKTFVKKMVVEDAITKDVIRELRAAIDIVRSHPRR